MVLVLDPVLLVSLLMLLLFWLLVLLLMPLLFLRMLLLPLQLDYDTHMFDFGTPTESTGQSESRRMPLCWSRFIHNASSFGSAPSGCVA